MDSDAIKINQIGHWSLIVFISVYSIDYIIMVLYTFKFETMQLYIN